jgi:hypothetical protein
VWSKNHLVPDAPVIFGSVDEYADGFVVVVASEYVIDKGDVEVEFAGIFGLEFAGFEFDDDVAR